MTKIKICGITNEEDALWAVELGVDALGFIFAPSPRRVNPERVQRIVSLLPPFISTVGVFVDGDEERVRKIAGVCSLTTLQFHGEESPAYCQRFGQKIIKSFRIKDRGILKKISQYKVDAYLMDTYFPGKPGGTGRTFDWVMAREVKKLGMPLILSGGLNPHNIAQAIIEVRPFAVDVSSGVEAKKGKKDYEKLREFVKRVRKQDEQLSTAQ